MNKNNYKNILMALLFMLIALPTAMMAQTNTERYMVVTENDGTVTVFDFDEVESVEWVMEQLKSGTAKAKINGNDVDVPWVQLWENGPRFAEYNVGATSVTQRGGYYCWGGSIDQDPNQSYNSGSDVLTGSDDTATNLWGNNWRMPTAAELQALLDNCDVVWVDNYNNSDISGRIFTGRGDYSGNSVFLPAAGWYNDLSVSGTSGTYWSSTPIDQYAYTLGFIKISNFMNVTNSNRSYGRSVRAVYSPQGK